MYRYTHCVEYEALGMDDYGTLQLMPLHILCENEEEAEGVAELLRRDKVQYSCVVVSELDEAIEED